jgi:hypothetical protein
MTLVRILAMCCCLVCGVALGQSADTRTEREAVAESISHVFATELGSGIYDLGGRTLQVYRLSWNRYLGNVDEDEPRVRFTLPGTFGFFDFKPIDVIEEGPPERIDSFSVKPGLELDIPLRDGWRVIPYANAGFSLASAGVEGWLYGAGIRADRHALIGRWQSLARTEFAYAGVKFRDDTPNDSFVRIRQGFDFTRGLGWSSRGHELELGLYGVVDVIIDPPTIPVANGGDEPMQLEVGFTLASRPRVKIWKFDAPRLGFGYRFAGSISGWRFVIGAPF